MKKGRMYACQVAYPQSLKLDEFSVSSAGEQKKGGSGDTVVMQGFAKISIALSTSGAAKPTVKVRLIRSGEMIYAFEDKLPLQIDYVDPYYKPGDKIYYRIDIKGAGTIVSNPIFISFK